MGEKDPGSKPQSNDRIPYCFINHKCLKCSICNCSISKDNCKWKCMKLFCPYHLNSHKKQCKKICRFSNAQKMIVNLLIVIHVRVYCVKYNSDKSLNENCCYYKHNLRNDKYKNVFHDKCKKILDTKLIQGDIIEHPQYIQEKKLLIDYRYYFEKQIRIPVEQIFGLTMAKPEKLTEDILRMIQIKKNAIHQLHNSSKLLKK